MVGIDPAIVVLVIIIAVLTVIRNMADDGSAAQEDTSGVLPHSEIKTGYYVAIRNHGLPLPPAGQQKEVVWVFYDKGEYVVHAHDPHSTAAQALPLGHFVFLEQWRGA